MRIYTYYGYAHFGTCNIIERAAYVNAHASASVYVDYVYYLCNIYVV